ncbi:MAG TPA: hypothetical protein ENK08_04790 [Chloroflexi bacterium]|nr:hypothetical protein [Chloroflexota bacterium]
MKKRYIWIVGVLLLLASLACSLGSAGGPTEQPSGGEQEETVEVTEQPPATEEEAEPEVAPGALKSLNSYRVRITWQWTAENGESEQMVIEQEATKEPPAQRIVITSAQEEGAIEFVQIGDKAWSCFNGSCIQTEQDPEELADQFGEEAFTDPATYFDTEKEFVGRETVNGINTRHYVLHLSPLEAAALSGGEITDLQSEVWVADEGDLPTFVVRFILKWKGTQNDQQGEGQYIYEVYAINAPIIIEPPEGAPTGLPEDVPAYPNAQDTAVMGGMITFSTPDEASVVAQFYKDQMPTEGWTLSDETDLGGMVSQTWTKEGRTLNLMISPGDEGTSVMIMLEE